MIGNRKKAMLRGKGKRMLGEWEIELNRNYVTYAHLRIKKYLRRELYKQC